MGYGASTAHCGGRLLQVLVPQSQNHPGTKKKKKEEKLPALYRVIAMFA